MNHLTMLPEWGAQSTIWTAWPHNRETWPHNLAEAQAEFVAFVRTIARDQTVHVLCGGSAYPSCHRALGATDNVRLIDIPTNDAWIRDYAPTFVRDEAGNQVAIDWNYNAWGGKYPPYDLDQQVATSMADFLGVRRLVADLCLEGGAIETNGKGIVLCTRSCALNPNRNPAKTAEEIEQQFARYLGARQTIWLSGDAIAGDDTDGHIDQLARFTNDRTIVYAWCEDKTDRQHDRLAANLSDLKRGLDRVSLSASASASSERADTSAPVPSNTFEWIGLPIPSPIVHRGRRIPASYCNFLITGSQVIVPQFGQAESDRRALEVLAPLFPNRAVMGLASLNLSVGLGSFHCLSSVQ